MPKIKKIGVLTSGGDAPGMNAATRTIVRYSLQQGITPYLIYNGYSGLIKDEIKEANLALVDDILEQSGTAIYSARFPEFAKKVVREQAIVNLQKRGIQALVVIGGDGTYQGAQKLTEMGINCVGLPGTIDNDISSTDFTIGYDSAVNVVVEAIRQVRSTSNSHGRVGIIETMGRQCGDIAIMAAQASDVDVLSVPEQKKSVSEIIAEVKKIYESGKRSVIVLVTELLYDANELVKAVEEGTGLITRATVLGHIQRGGKPSSFDRWLAFNMAITAVDLLTQGIGGKCISYRNGRFESVAIMQALSLPRPNKLKTIDLIEKINQTV